MTQQPTSFADAFDAIDLDPARVPSPAAIEAAMEICAPDNQPGFYLLDDADGRFVVDREFGVISLADEATLESERGAVHTALLKVVELSGESYELTLRLRLSGRVPQVVASETDTTPARTRSEADEPDAPLAMELPRTPWSRFAGFAGVSAEPLHLAEHAAPYGALALCEDMDADGQAINITLPETPPRPAAADAAWSL